MNLRDNLKHHDWIYISLLVLNFGIYLSQLFLISFNTTRSGNLFPKSVETVTNIYKNDIKPNDWSAELINGCTIIFQLKWMIYGLINVFRRTFNGLLFYRKFSFINRNLLMIFLVNQMASIAWLFSYSHELIGISAFCSFVQLLSLLACFFESINQLNQVKSEMIRYNLNTDVTLTKLVLHNGLGLYLAAITIKALLNFDLYLIYVLKYDVPSSGTVCLSILADLLIIFFVIDIFICKNKMNIVFSPWIVFILTFASIISNNWLRTSFIKNNVISLILLIVSSLLALIKIIIVVYKLLARDDNQRRYFNSNDKHHAKSS